MSDEPLSKPHDAVVPSEQLPSKETLKEKVTGDSKEGQSGKDQPHSPAPDFTALIQTIKDEGIAYRKEEQSEDTGKRRREWITIGLLFVTVIAIGWQVREMVKVYGPIRDQAEAARQQAENSELGFADCCQY